MEDQVYQKYIQKLGKSEPVRRWLMTMFLTTSYHVTTRPISKANAGFFKRMAHVNDRLFELLKEPGWELLEPEIEYGFNLMDEMSSKNPDPETKKQMKVDFKKNYKRYFKAINPPWSSLTPNTNLSIQDWKNPKEILLAFGANSGIGDEFIYYRLTRRLATMYPDARISVISYQNTMWDLCPNIDNVTYHKHDQLAPFMAAIDVMERDEENLVIFSEFASITIYRQMEGLDCLRRYIYLDTGAKHARIVNAEKKTIGEWSIERPATMYHLLDGLMNYIGLVNDKITEERSLPIRQAPFYQSERKRVYLNPFTSKDYGIITPEWWVESLARIAEFGDFSVEVFEGINEDSRNYSSIIIDGIQKLDNVELYREEGIPSIAETIEKAADSDLVFGIDTFTGHVGILQTTPCFTIFLGSQWHFWKIPDNFVLNADAFDDPQIIGGLVSLMLFPEAGKHLEQIETLISLSDQFLAGKIRDESSLRSLLTKGENAVKELLAADKRMRGFSMDIPESYYRTLKSAVFGNDFSMEDPAVRKLLKQAAKFWLDSNLHRYCRYVLHLEKQELVALA